MLFPVEVMWLVQLKSLLPNILIFLTKFQVYRKMFAVRQEQVVSRVSKGKFVVSSHSLEKHQSGF